MYLCIREYIPEGVWINLDRSVHKVSIYLSMYLSNCISNFISNCICNSISNSISIYIYLYPSMYVKVSSIASNILPHKFCGSSGIIYIYISIYIYIYISNISF
jgi:hypothetical protein